jgi:hypothetical protein
VLGVGLRACAGSNPRARYTPAGAMPTVNFRPSLNFNVNYNLNYNIPPPLKLSPYPEPKPRGRKRRAPRNDNAPPVLPPLTNDRASPTPD